MINVETKWHFTKVEMETIINALINRQDTLDELLNDKFDVDVQIEYQNTTRLLNRLR